MRISISKLGSLVSPMLVLAFAAPLSAQGRRGGAVPPGQRPPAGMCRVWIDGVPPGRQPAPTDCATAYRMAGPNARVIDGRGQYGYDRSGYDRGQYGYGRYEDNQSFPGNGKGKWKQGKHRDRDYDREGNREGDDRYDRRSGRDDDDHYERQGDRDDDDRYDREDDRYDRQDGGRYDRGSYGGYDRRDGAQSGASWPANPRVQPRAGAGAQGQGRIPSRLDPRNASRQQGQVPSRMQPRIGSRPGDSANNARRAPWERRP